MRFTSLHMKDFRATRELEIGFEPDMTVIVGRNGAGKTSILDALAAMIGLLRTHLNVPSNSSIGLRPFLGDVRERAKNASLEMEYVIGISEASKLANILAIRISNNGIVEEIALQDPSVLPEQIPLRLQFAYYRQDRGFSTGPQAEQGLPTADMFDPDIVQDRSLEKNFQAIDDLAAWWDRRDTQEARRVRDGDRNYRDPQLEAIRSLVEKIDNFSSIFFDSTSSPAGLHFIKEDGTLVHVGSLSGGERSYLVLLADLARRLQVFAPDKSLEDISAIVLIDEIELNLHPAWQSEIVPVLSEVFASCQFIVTTHSPQVLSGVESRQVRIVEVDASDSSSKVTVPLSTRGRTSNYLLEGVLGSSERFPPVDALVGEFNEAIDGGDTETAAARLAELEEQIEDDAATLLVLRKRLKKLRGAA